MNTSQVGIQTEDTKKSTHQYCFKGGARGFQKRTKEVLDTLIVGFTVVSIDESFFFYDSIVREVLSRYHPRITPVFLPIRSPKLNLIEVW
jgi:hypothetical protein